MPTFITTRGAIEIIRRNVSGCLMTTIDINKPCDDRMNKTDNPFYGMGVRKTETLNGVIGFNYQNAINRVADRQGEQRREAQPRKWGVLTHDRIFVNFKGKWYLQMKVEQVLNVRYQYSDGVLIDTEVLQPFLKPNRDKDVDIKDIDMFNIVGLRFKHAEYRIIPEDGIPMETEVQQQTEPVI